METVVDLCPSFCVQFIIIIRILMLLLLYYCRRKSTGVVFDECRHKLCSEFEKKEKEDSCLAVGGCFVRICGTFRHLPVHCSVEFEADEVA
jgi:hypothetical protein